jgi:hypothetical protein
LKRLSFCVGHHFDDRRFGLSDDHVSGCRGKVINISLTPGWLALSCGWLRSVPQLTLRLTPFLLYDWPGDIQRNLQRSSDVLVLMLKRW